MANSREPPAFLSAAGGWVGMALALILALRKRPALPLPLRPALPPPRAALPLRAALPPLPLTGLLMRLPARLPAGLLTRLLRGLLTGLPTGLPPPLPTAKRSRSVRWTRRGEQTTGGGHTSHARPGTSR